MTCLELTLPFFAVSGRYMWANEHSTEALVHTSYRSAYGNQKLQCCGNSREVLCTTLAKFGRRIIPSYDYIKITRKHNRKRDRKTLSAEKNTETNTFSKAEV